jgi:dipeptidase E
MKLSSAESSPSLNALKIMAIGGGAPSGASAPAIREALSMADADRPSALIVPTAKRTQEAYNTSVTKTGTFLRDMGLRAISLHLFGEDLDTKEGAEKIESADFIYTAGGDTKYLMEYLHNRELDTLITKRALAGEVVLAGVSAGAILPMTWGHSDSLSYRPETADTWDYIPVAGLGIVPTAITPHFNTSNERHGARSAKFIEMLSSRPGDRHTFGIDNLAAMRVVNGEVTQFQSDPDHFVHSVEKDKNGNISVHPLTKNDRVPLVDLLS